MLKRLFILAAAAAMFAPILAAAKEDAKPARSNVEMRRRDGSDYHEYLYDSHGIITPYPLNEQHLPARFYRSGYQLTPREYYRWRAAGFSQQEVYLIANASRDTGLDPSTFANAIYRGLYAKQIGYEYLISERSLTRILPEWRTAAWAAATGDPAIKRDRLNIWY
jgi:hypothetical protein